MVARPLVGGLERVTRGHLANAIEDPDVKPMGLQVPRALIVLCVAIEESPNRQLLLAERLQRDTNSQTAHTFLL